MIAHDVNVMETNADRTTWPPHMQSNEAYMNEVVRRFNNWVLGGVWPPIPKDYSSFFNKEKKTPAQKNFQNVVVKALEAEHQQPGRPEYNLQHSLPREAKRRAIENDYVTRTPPDSIPTFPTREVKLDKVGTRHSEGPGQGQYVVDNFGREICYDPPKDNESHVRQYQGEERPVYWCGHCGRWGNHDTGSHGVFVEQRRQRAMARQLHQQRQGQQPGLGGPTAMAAAVQSLDSDEEDDNAMKSLFSYPSQF